MHADSVRGRMIVVIVEGKQLEVPLKNICEITNPSSCDPIREPPAPVNLSKNPCDRENFFSA
jgi:hypothetical protein